MSATGLRVDGVAVAIGEVAILLRGKPGSGKSDLALRLVDEGARLISDEQVELERRGDVLFAMVPALMPEYLIGRLEVRGLGIVSVPHVNSPLPLTWVFDMMSWSEIDRMPAAEQANYLGIEVPVLKLDPAGPSATAKLRLAVKCGSGQIMGRS
jgi:HPr kinase/phosphorylase